MLAARRVAELRQLTRQLHRVSREAATTRARGPGGGLAITYNQGGVGAAVLTNSSASTAHPVDAFATARDGRLAQVRGVREKILFRRAPIAVSLLERSLLTLDRRVRRASPPLGTAAQYARGADGDHPASDPAAVLNAGDAQPAGHPAGAVSVEPGLHAGAVTCVEEQQQEEEKRVWPVVQAVLPDSPGTPVYRRYALLAGDAVQLLCALEQERRALLVERRRRAARAVRRADEGPTAAEAATASAALAAARADERLLQRSLLSRPLLSARLWRLLLAEHVWVGAAQLQRQATAAKEESFFLLSVSLLFSRLVLGVTKDYVDGSEVSRRSPRFVVSLPSQAYLAGAAASTDDRTSPTPCERDNDNGDDDADGGPRQGGSAESDAADVDAMDDMLALMLTSSGSGAAAAAPAPAPPDTKPAFALANRQRRTAALRWVPPHSADVLPLLAETLAMFAVVLPELDAAAIVRAGLTSELASLLANLQKMATTAILLTEGSPASGREAGAASLQRSLPRLEREMTALGGALFDAFAVELQASPADHRGPAPPPLAALSPVKAARLAVELDRLQLLDVSRDPRARAVLEGLLIAVFPELRTNTQRALVGKARQSSLLAFATKAHREKLYRQHGGRAGAEAFVRGTVVQRARLEQRRMAAALREQHLTSTHLQFVAVLGRDMPAHDLVTLFRRLVTAAGALPGTAGSTAALTAPDPLQESRLTTAALFVAEALLVSGSLRSATSEPRGGDEPTTLELPDLVHLWTATAALWPVVDARRERALMQSRLRRDSRVADVRTESAILAFATESVLTGVSAHLESHLGIVSECEEWGRGARQGRGRSRPQPPRSPQSQVSAESLATMALGLLVWHEVEPSARHHRSAALEQHVRLTEKLLRECVLKDPQLWHEVRAWDVSKREAFERRMLECFRTANLLDAATTRAVQKACSSL